MARPLGMFRRLVILMGLFALGFALSSCTKCGPFWEEWMRPSPKSDNL